ncbi:unnamed protein product [Hydatigera taeniaeformis]|uniref:Uncharacterized protein n=1 Tax=Hydatigena taeniaeformis TaxID=6205 RepID=A0A0R3WXM3_HYDTA|nr:unnamed protein product [Hydatigera taeniaeformis]
MFTTQGRLKEVPTPQPKKDADDICRSLFVALAVSGTSLSDLCVQLKQVADTERKELHSLLESYLQMFSWEDEVHRLVDEGTRDDVVTCSKSPWPSSIALVERSDGDLPLDVDY